jgi:hypothetical protein
MSNNVDEMVLRFMMPHKVGLKCRLALVDVDSAQSWAERQLVFVDVLKHQITKGGKKGIFKIVGKMCHCNGPGLPP